MTFTDFCEKLLLALYQDGHKSDDWLHVMTLQSRYGLNVDEAWRSKAMNFLKSRGDAEGRELVGEANTAMAKITGSGIVYIEEKYGDKDGVGQVLTPIDHNDDIGDNFLDPADNLPTDYLNDREPSDIPIDSSTWTGLPKQGVMSEVAVGKLKGALRVAEDALSRSNATNEEMAQARAYVIAIHALADAPCPPADQIWSLIQAANGVAGIASFFVSLIALFQTAIH